MKRRKILKWTAPVVTAVVLPAHAVTTDTETETCCVTDSTTPAPTLPPTTQPPVTTKPPVTTEPPVTTLPPNPCPDGETLICHNPHKEAITKCVDDDEILRHINHGDFFGACND